MCEEYNAQIKNHTWDLTEQTTLQNIITCKSIFTIKYHADGFIERYKVRLVARGFHQQYGRLDYSETFSSVIKPTTVRMVLDVAVKKNWSIHQLDINHAFLPGTLMDEVYVPQPPGFIDSDRPHHVCRFNKALYGLKQAPRAWYNELRNFLLQSGFTNSLADTSLFIYNQLGNSCIYILVYVDDILLAGDSTSVKAAIASLSARFSLKDLGELSYFLGIEAIRSRKGLHLMQKKYINDLLHKLNMADAKPVNTPMKSLPKLSSEVFSTSLSQVHRVYGQQTLTIYSSPNRSSLESRETCLEISCRHNKLWYFLELHYTTHGSCLLRRRLGRRCR